MDTNVKENDISEAEELQMAAGSGTEGRKISKKAVIIISVSAALVAVLVGVIISLCSVHPIYKFALTMFTSNSYCLDLTVEDIPIFGDITVEMKVDGNVTHISESLLGSERYNEKIDGESYVYTKILGVWVKEKRESVSSSLLDSEAFSPEKLKEVFDTNNFERIKGEKNAFKQKSDVSFEHIKDVVIRVGDDEMTVEMIAFASGFEVKTRIVISQIGEVELSLPSVE